MKTMKSMLAVGTAALFALPALTLAAPFNYINLSGDVETIEADTAAEALLIMAANGDALHSGVALDVGLLDEGEDYGIVYNYISTSGETKTVTAASADAAYLVAHDILPGTLTPIHVENAAL